MTTQTPRTDAERFIAYGELKDSYGQLAVTADFARQLECELIYANEVLIERDRLRELNAELRDALNECITDDGAVCFEHREYLARRVSAVSDIARAALAKVKGN